MNHDTYRHSYIREILADVKTIAMVGASSNAIRPSYFAMKYLQEKGYRVIPVNPREAGHVVLGETFYETLADIPDPVDMVDVFRNAEAADAITDEAIAIGASVLWMQLGVRNDAAAERAEAAGLKVVMNRCPKIEFGKHSGEWRWIGGNSGLISAKKPTLAKGRVQSLTITSKKP